MTTETSSTDDDAAVHSLAVSISRELNLVNPNDLLARRMLQLARQNAESLTKFQAAAKTFGKFRDVFLQEVWMDSKAAHFTALGAREAEAPTGALTPPIHSNGHDASGRIVIGNLVIEDSEILMPPPPQKGGLMRPGLKTGTSSDKHLYKPSNGTKVSELGLDKLAAEKRRERLLSASESDSDREAKRSRYDSGEDSNDSDSGPHFRGASLLSHAVMHIYTI